MTPRVIGPVGLPNANISGRRVFFVSRTTTSGSFCASEQNVGVEFKGVRSGVERRRARDPGREETPAGRESP
eukprot:31292-Pelagococcus_subviridis.AAC.3